MITAASIDALLGPHAHKAGPALRAAIATRIDDTGRFHDWSAPGGPSFRWNGWFLHVTVAPQPRRPVGHEPRRTRCSCGCFGLPCVSEQVGQALVNALHRLGFWLGRDRDAAVHGHSLVHHHRHAARRGLRGLLRWFPTGAEVQWYVDRNPVHRAGPRYALRPELAASYLDTKLLELTRAALTRTLAALGYRDRTSPVITDPVQAILWAQLTCGHWRPGVGLAPTASYSHRTGDGVPLFEGMRVQVYGYGRGGVLREGVAFCALNDSWHVASGAERFVCSSRELLSWRPERPRRWTPPEVEKRRICAELELNVRRENFGRAAVLKRLRDERGLSS